MNILHLITSLNRGGAENHLTCLIRGQIKHKKKIYIIYLKGDDYWVDHLKSIGAEVIRIKYLNIFKCIKKIKTILRIKKINILHAHLPHMELLGYLAVIGSTNLKFIITKHVDNDYLGGSSVIRKSYISSIISYFVYSRVDKIIAISQSVKKFLIDSNFQDIKEKIKVIYYGLDDFYINKCLRVDKKNCFKKKSKLTFGFIGRLVKQKQVDKIILSFKKYLNESNYDAELLIVGSGPEKKKILNLSKKLKLGNKIILQEFTNDVGKIYDQIDVFCINSSFEGLGLVMLEAMANSKPIIGPHVSAIPEVIKNNENGLLVIPNDINDYKNAMIKISNIDLRNKLSSNSLKFLNKNFDYQLMLSKTDEIYNL